MVLVVYLLGAALGVPTVTVAVMLFIRVAVTVAVVLAAFPAAHGEGFETVTLKFAVKDPFGTVTVDGTFTEELLLERCTTMGAAFVTPFAVFLSDGAACMRRIVPVADPPAITDPGSIENEYSPLLVSCSADRHTGAKTVALAMSAKANSRPGVGRSRPRALYRVTIRFYLAQDRSRNAYCGASGRSGLGHPKTRTNEI